MTSHRERLEACLSGEQSDPVPVALWRHFPVDDQAPEQLAAATLAFQKTFDFDLVKVSPASSFCLKDWGVKDEWRGETEGTRTYTQRVIQQPEDWSRLPILDPSQGVLADQLNCLQIITRELGPQTPVIQTIFNPLSQAKNLVGRDKLLVHLRHHPSALHAGLKTITESTVRFIEAAQKTGIAGVFYAVQHAQYSLLSREEYQEFGEMYDLLALEPAHDFWLNMLHLHGMDIMFEQFLDYPVQIINWHDRETSPSLTAAQEMFSGVVCGGISRETAMVYATAEQVQKEAREAIRATQGQRFILGTGCVVPTIAPFGNLMAARKSAAGR
jgi:uroporphyrinogen decarboxylase